MTVSLGRTDRQKRAQADRVQYRYYLALVMPIALLCVLVKRTLSLVSSTTEISTLRTPFIREVTGLCHDVVPWIFMGR